MKATIHPAVIYRVPRFPFNAEIKSSWAELKQAIQFSSTEFYEIIKDITPDEIESLPQTVRQTIWKYFNRSKFRATPYGTFASFGLSQLVKQSGSPTLIINQNMIVHRFPDWTTKDKLVMNFEEVFEKNELLFTNSTYYIVGSNIRYVYFEDGVFQLSEIQYDVALIGILQQCSKPIKITALLKTISEQDQPKLLSQIKYLTSVQLLLHSGQPNIIGQDYFKRRGANHIIDSNDYIFSERQPLAGGIGVGIFRHIPALVEQLRYFIAPVEDLALSTFISRFLKRFEHQEISLMIALDPEVGVGYDELEQTGADDVLITNLSMFSQPKSEDGFKKQLFKSVIANTETPIPFIDLEQFDAPYPQSQLSTANTISLMCNVTDGAVQIENIGGTTANALNGRFTMPSEEVHTLCVELNELEQQANPDVIFFDIGYTAENKVDNINRRKSIYTHQLNLLNYDTSDEPLSLTDLVISVKGKELILRSKLLGKRMIPRLSSAYNYQRSDLSVFRLLCDLQRQGLQVNLNLSLESILPDIDYYPELRFRNIVLSPRKWKLHAHQIDNYSNFQKFMSGLENCKYVRTGTGDQTLCFDLACRTDLEILYRFIRKEKQFVIEETLIPKESIIKDNDGKPYLGQFILNLTHAKTLYKPIVSLPSVFTKKSTVLFPPGGEWLYFEIYCHPYRADEMLLEKIQPFLIANYTKIKTWFFIRYNEGGNHIRLRLRLNDPKKGYQLTDGLSQALKQEIECGIVADLRTSIYRREIDRYGDENMEDIEAHFGCDSTFIMKLLHYNPDAFTKYRWCIALMELVAGSGVFEDEVLYHIARRNSDAFNKEHNLGTEDFKKLNKEYNLYRHNNFEPLNTVLLKGSKIFKNSFLSVLRNCPEYKKAALFTDLMHMHINRLFCDHQRSHEMVFYYFLVKGLQRQKAMQ